MQLSFDRSTSESLANSFADTDKESIITLNNATEIQVACSSLKQAHTARTKQEAPESAPAMKKPIFISLVNYSHVMNWRIKCWIIIGIS